MMLILLLLTVVSAECDSGKFGQRINDIDWSQYVTNFKDQTGTPLCWAFSTTSYIEIMYHYLTGIKNVFSARQVGENAMQERLWRFNYSCYYPSTQLTPGYPVCAAKYIAARGLMFDADYKLYGYDVKRTVPLKLGERQIIFRRYGFNAIIQQLKRTPLLAYYSTSHDHFPDVINNDYDPNHVVVLTNVCKRNTTIYLELLNSYGSDFCNHGYTYVRITDDNGYIVNNRQILDYMLLFDLTIPVNVLPHERNYVPIILESISNFTVIVLLVALLIYTIRLCLHRHNLRQCLKHKLSSVV
jgi:hypothetical protein